MPTELGKPGRDLASLYDNAEVNSGETGDTHGSNKGRPAKRRVSDVLLQRRLTFNLFLLNDPSFFMLAIPGRAVSL